MSKSLQTSGLEAPKSKSRGRQGGFGGVLDRLGPSGAFLEASWTVLEASWSRLEGLLGRLGPKRCKLASKTEPKSIKAPKLDQFLMALGIIIFGFKLNFGAKH